MKAVAIDSLVVMDTVRLAGINNEHVRVLAESTDQLPPILVSSTTMHVIDGMHRLAAARLQGRKTVDVRFFEGDQDAAFVEAVQANIAHGLPLTLADRRAAAARIIRMHKRWSNRRVAELAGLSPKTVGVVRALLTEEIPQLTARVGRDGRIRRLPVRQPDNETGTTADDQRTQGKVMSGPLREPRRSHQATPPPRDSARVTRLDTAPRERADPDHCRNKYRRMRHDPSLRMTETGRFLLRLLDLHLTRVGEWEQLVTNVPPHQAASVAELAWECARTWLEFAQKVGIQEIQAAQGETDRLTTG